MPTITNNLTVQEWTVLYETFKTEKNPDTDVLQRFLDAPYNKTFTSPERDKWYHDYMYALRLKLESLTKEPSPIEKNDDSVTTIRDRQSLMGRGYTTKKYHRNPCGGPLVEAVWER